jgi:WD40 repeat protein
MGHFCCFLKVSVYLLIFLRDGRILSGGMDKLLCLWDAKVVKCQNLVGHNGSISKVKVDDQNIAVTSAYDSSLLVWNLDTKECL